MRAGVTRCPDCDRPVTVQNPLGEEDGVIACQACHEDHRRFREARKRETDVVQDTPPTPETHTCQVCRKPLAVGQQGCIVRIVDHEPVGAYHPFIGYFDVALGEQVDSLAQRWRLMKKQEAPDGTVARERLEYRDKMSKGDLSARNDRIHERLVREGREARER